MRFRASVDNPSTFLRIMQSVEKLQKRCIIKFTETDMHIICAPDFTEGEVQIWSQIGVPTLFTDYRIQSNANNEITLKLSTDALLAALRSASSSPSTSSAGGNDIVMKLAKKNDQAVLSFEITGLSRAGKALRVSHDVRIEVMRPDDVEKLIEPMCPEPDVHFVMPPLAKLRTVVERLRSLSNIIGLRANNDGKLILSVSTEGVKMDVTWTGLSNPSVNHGEPNSQELDSTQPPTQRKDPTRIYGLLLSIKSFVKFLNCHVLSAATVACLCQNHSLILYVYLGDAVDSGGVLTFYLPAIIDEP